MKRLQTRRMASVTGRIVAGLAAVLLYGPPETAAAPGAAGLARLFSCDAPQPVFADFDGNGAVDRVDVGGTNHDSIWITLNSGAPTVLRQSAATCRVVVSDFDRDNDADLIAFTRRGHVLLWRNDGRVLHEVRPLQPPHRRQPGAASAWHARTPLTADVGSRMMPCAPEAAAQQPLDRAVPRGAADAGHRQVSIADAVPSRAPPPS